MFIIDRFEGDLAVIEYQGQTFALPRRLLPPEAKEGQVLKLEFFIDHNETRKRTAKIKRLMDELFQD